MADFVQVMKDWRRMCQAQDDGSDRDVCETCPNGECIAIYEDDSMDYAHLENVVTKWAAEHPEPVYETWFEWLEKIGVAGRAYDLEPYFTGDKEIFIRTAAFTLKAFDPIPADVAKKLGIKPKEG